MIRRAAGVSVAVCMCAATAVSLRAAPPASDPGRVVATARAGNQAMAHARYLAGDIGPRLTGTKRLARAERWAAKQFESFGLADVRLERWGEMSAPRARGGVIAVHNVIADIRGSEHPDELVIVGAHLDSWDFAHGATDNAAGCAAVMEAARLLVASGVQPKRTIRFVLWTGEEQGLLGSSAYVAAHPELLGKTSVVFNLDAGTNPISGLVATEGLRDEFEQAFAGVTALGQPFELRTVAALTLPADCCSQSVNPATGTCTGTSDACALPPDQSGCPSDHVAFLRAGVPAFMFEQKGSADYAHTHHTAHDTVDALDAKGIEHSAVVLALAALGVADLPGLLARDGLIASIPGASGGAASCTPSCSK
ncbi:MAG TPA: M20/M25/M40 family metallo-hydrolase [Candidatus Krumholzibacteria bacterium]